MPNDKKFIIITSIFGPTEAVIAFSKMHGYTLVVVADKKTPQNWDCPNVHYLSVEKQEGLGFNILPVLPYNIYPRKMVGYLYAMSQGATVIIDTDDDNIPKADWEFPPMQGTYDTIKEDSGFVNVYKLYSDEHIWARGLPLGYINKPSGIDGNLSSRECNVGIWQGLADEDPDVDAIYRLTSDKPCYFKDREPVVLARNTVSPFNTQNTYVIRELFPLLYLPAHVTFRFTDILKGMVAQPIMWLYGYELGFVKATVVQKRNPHDYFKDFISEIPMYQYTQKAFEIAMATVTKQHDIKSNLYHVYEALHKNGIVVADELKVLEAWLKDIG